jgi:prepilin-type N-terminal cleavage/methylation domain-containing protein
MSTMQRLTRKPRTLSRHRRTAGFTLVELLVVMAIIAILVAIIVPTIVTLRRMAKRTATKDLIFQTNAAIQNYSQDWGSAPPDFCPAGARFLAFSFTAAGDTETISGDTRLYLKSSCGSMDATTEALFYYLTNAALTSTAYLELQKDVQWMDYNGNRLPEAVDSWGRPLLYNRAPFPSGPSGYDTAGNPIHGLPGTAVPFDLFSVGPDGVTSNGNDPLPAYRTALKQFNDKALQGGYGNGPDDIYNW